MLTRIITLKAAGLWVVALAMVLSTCVLSAERQGTETVVLKPGQNIQEIVENSPEGTGSVSSPASIVSKQFIRRIGRNS